MRGGAVFRPGFASPVADSQTVFRRLLAAMSEPGSQHDTAVHMDPPPALDSATAALCLTLLDFETPVWLDAQAGSGETPAYLRFHCGCPLAAEPGPARFAVLAAPAAMPPLADFAIGSEAYPDESATLIVQTASFDGGEPVALSGPGIAERRTFGPAGLPRDFWRQRRALEVLFPQGLDLIFTLGARLAAVPRSTRVEL